MVQTRVESHTTGQSQTIPDDPSSEAEALAQAVAVKAETAEFSTPEPSVSNAFELLDATEKRGPRDLVIVAVGDVSQPATQWVERTESQQESVFDPTRHLITGDLNVMNLENPVTEDEPSAQKTYAFTSPPERLNWYFGAGFNMYSLANNHIADADQPGIDHTIENLEKYAAANEMPVYHAGAGKTPEEGLEARFFTPEGKDLEVAFFSVGFSRSPNVGKFWDEELVPKIEEASERADVVIVAVHAGKEYKHIPEPDLAARYRTWVDAGADIVLGHHPHVIQPVEDYKGALIFYSLGNYVFASRTIRHRKMGAKMYSMMARIVIHDGELHGTELVPLWVNNSEDWKLESGEVMPNAHFAPKVLTDGFADAWFEDFGTWSKEAGATPPERIGDVGFIRVQTTAGPVALFF